MRQLAEQIAVLDGLDLSSISIEDGRIGQTRAQPTQYARQVMPGVLARRNVIDASEGGNYSGGSSYAPGLPLMPSTVGLAGFGVASMLPPKRHVIDASGGANYSGGSSYAPGLPLLPSSSGLAQADGYGRAGLGQAADGYGRAGLGYVVGSYTDQDLMGAFHGLEALRALDPNDGRIGQKRADATQYARAVMPGVTARTNVIDASEGANYSGGSSYAPGLPLMPSTVGLAGIDALDDLAFTRKLAPRLRSVFKKAAGRAAMRRAAASAARGAQKARSASPAERAQGARMFAAARMQLQRMRATRKAILTQNTVNGVPVFATTAFSPSMPATMWK